MHDNHWRWDGRFSVKEVYTEEVKVRCYVSYTLKWSLVGWGWEEWFCWNLEVILWNCNELLISTRQKQYFEQRKRKQQNLQMMGSDNCYDSPGISGQNPKEHRSLDILNLLNLSTKAQQCNLFCPEGKHRIFFLHNRFAAALSLQTWKMISLSLYI